MQLINPMNYQGSVYINALKNEPNTYYGVVEENGRKLLRKFENEKPVPITMTDPHLFLYRTRNYDGTINVSHKAHSDEGLKVTFKGNSSKLHFMA